MRIVKDGKAITSIAAPSVPEGIAADTDGHVWRLQRQKQHDEVKD